MLSIYILHNISKQNMKIIYKIKGHNNMEFSSVAQSCPALCNPMDCSTSITSSQSLLKLMLHQVIT